MSASIVMKKHASRLKRKGHIRVRVSGSTERPRLSVYRSLNHIYAQVIDDVSGKTLVAASTLSPELKESRSAAGKEARPAAGKEARPAAGKDARSAAGRKKELAKEVGKLVAKKCAAAQIAAVVFDRNGFNYHGRVAAVAEGAREGGLKF